MKTAPLIPPGQTPRGPLQAWDELHDETSGVASLREHDRKKMRRLNLIRTSLSFQLVAIICAVGGIILATVGEYKAACQLLGIGFMAEAVSRLIEPSKI